MKKSLLSLAVLLLTTFSSIHAQIIITVAGNGTNGYAGDGGMATAAEINEAEDVGIDDSANIYISDLVNCRIRKVGRTGIITNICGTGYHGYSGDGSPAIYSQISGKEDFAFDHHGNIYFADEGNACVRKINTAGIISTIVGTGVWGYNGDGIPATMAQLGPTGIVFDKKGNLYIEDHTNNRIRKVDTFGIITTIAGIGTVGFSPDGSRADTCKLSGGSNIRIDRNGNLYFADNRRIRRIDTFGILTTVAGTGVTGYNGDGGMATATQIDGGTIAIDTSGNIYIAEVGNSRVRKVSTAGIINTIAGNGIGGYSGDSGDPLLARLGFPFGVALDTFGNIYIADSYESRIREITFDSALAVNNVRPNKSKLLIVPNPTHNTLTIKAEGLKGNTATLTCYNSTGRLVAQKSETLSNGNLNATLNLGGMPVGVYELKIQSENGESVVRKVVVE